MALLSLAPALLALRGGDLAAYHGVEHKAIAAYEQDGGRRRRRQGARPLRLEPGGADAGRRRPSGNVAARRAGLRGPAAEARSRSAAWRWRSRCSPGRSATPTPRWRGCCAARATRSSALVGTREPTAEQLEVGPRGARRRSCASRPRPSARPIRRPWRPRPARARGSTRRSSASRSSGSARATTRTPTSTSPRSCSRREGHRPRVTMQVFQKQDSVLGGIDEAIAVLKLVLGPRTADGGWRDGWDELEVQRAPRGRRDRAVRDRDDDRGRLRAVRPPRDRLPRLHGPPHAGHAQRARGGRGGATASRSCSSPRATTTGSCRPATAGRRTWPARSASRPTPRRRGGAAAAWARCPHALIAAYGGDTVAAAQAFAERFARRDERDRAGRLRERLRAHRARGGRRARRQALGRAARHLREAGGPRALARDGRLQADRREPGAGRAGARGARRGRPRAT